MTGWPAWDQNVPSYEEELESKISALENESSKGEEALERSLEMHFYNERLVEEARKRRIRLARERAWKDPRAFNRGLWEFAKGLAWVVVGMVALSLLWGGIAMLLFWLLRIWKPL
jgi:hypothetical protein